MAFTKENARACALKSHEPTSARFVHPVEPANEATEADEFRRMRLARVRAQLNAIDKAIAGELAGDCDPAKLDRLASAAIRLNEQERQLSNRSLPPTLKAGPVPRAKRNQEAPEPSPE
jgi:hypothetical protein